MGTSEHVVVGTVASVSASGFTVATGSGQVVTVRKRASTSYWETGSLTPARSVTRGARVAVLVIQAGSAIAAEAVAVLPASVWSLPGA